MAALMSCFYMLVRPIPEEGEPEQPREGFGYLSRQAAIGEPPSYSSCSWWDSRDADDYFDGMWTAGKAMSFLAVIVGFIVMCITLCTCCVAFQLPTFEGLFWTAMFCFAAQCLTFLSWGTDMCDEMECTWAPGSGTQISAAMLWLWAANMLKSFPEALPPRHRGQRGDMYEDDDEYYDDSPYLNRPGGFDDEYGEEEEWGPNEEPEYYDDEGEYYNDQDYDNRGYSEDDYGEQEAPSIDPYSVDDTNDADGYLQEEGGEEEQYDDYTNDEYTESQYTTDYSEPSRDALVGNGRQYDDAEWEEDEDENETYDTSTEGNYYQSGEGGLSREELEYLGEDSTMGGDSSISGLD